MHKQSPSLLEVVGPSHLEGTIHVSGFKHSAVTIIAASVLADEPVVLENVPAILDVFVLVEILRSLGSQITFQDHTLYMNHSSIHSTEIAPRLASLAHGNIYLIPALVSKFKSIYTGLPGGCRIGDLKGGERPYRHILDVLSTLGADVIIDQRIWVGTEDLVGHSFDFGSLEDLSMYSGSTKAAIIAAVGAKGQTVIRNPYRAAEVLDLINFLKCIGASILVGEEGFTISGGQQVKGGRHRLQPDLLEIVTFIVAAAVTRSRIVIRGFSPQDIQKWLRREFDLFERVGIKFEFDEGSLTVNPPDRLRPASAVVDPHCGMYSDSHPLMSAMLSLASGKSRIEERVWKKRFHYVPELRKLGPKIAVNGSIVHIEGVKVLRPNQCLVAHDVRAAACLLLAALAAPGKTFMRNAEHLHRGYENLVGKLKSLGADIVEIEA